MFTGIIEHLGTISRLETGPSGGKLTIHAPALANQLAVSASIAVNGCCLTVIHHDRNHFSADLSVETIARTSFSSLKPGARVNLERPLTAGQEFGGHFVLGHVDTVGHVAHLKQHGDSRLLGIHIPAGLAPYMVSKGSLTIDGISLTVASWHGGIAEISVIPYTYQHTNIADRSPGDPVNLEADILGKYIERYLSQRESSSRGSVLHVADLVGQGF